MVRTIAFEVNNRAGLYLSSRGAAVTSAAEASQVYVPAVLKRTYLFSGTVPILSAFSVNGCSAQQSVHEEKPGPTPTEPQGATSIRSNDTLSDDRGLAELLSSEGEHEI